jgi:hypothetical protein
MRLGELPETLVLTPTPPKSTLLDQEPRPTLSAVVPPAAANDPLRTTGNHFRGRFLAAGSEVIVSGHVVFPDDHIVAQVAYEDISKTIVRIENGRLNELFVVYFQRPLGSPDTANRVVLNYFATDPEVGPDFDLETGVAKLIDNPRVQLNVDLDGGGSYDGALLTDSHTIHVLVEDAKQFKKLVKKKGTSTERMRLLIKGLGEFGLSGDPRRFPGDIDLALIADVKFEKTE